ncbi:ATP synthase F0 subunit B [Sulfobacillus acidophilus]|uniref:ATP synthase subunit b n=1 Tax=Sulfobacillus acidophilus TaxID=53633 RepID=A0ABS3AWL0_9FIRM|nr:ATP synthase F0 subunit B [Sulfobacillus acidophilus]
MEINITLLVQIFLFSFLLVWLSQFLFAPLLKVIEEREKRIEGAKKEAENISKIAHEKLTSVEEKVAIAQKQARQSLANLKAEGAAYQRSIIEEAKNEAKGKLELARKDLSEEIKKNQKILTTQTDILSEKIVQKLLRNPFVNGASSPHSNKMECSNA